MFIRFKRVKLSQKIGFPDEYSLHAVLVQSFRQNGKPRQQIIAYLGAIREGQLRDQTHLREFYDLIQNKLRKLNLHPRELSKVQINFINTFVHKVSRPSQRTV